MVTKHTLRVALLSAAALAFAAGSSFAQTAVPLDKLVQHGDAAKKSTERFEITQDVARKIVDACVDFAKKNNIAISVFVIDSYGNIVDSTRMDGQMKINIDTALMKARTALVGRNSTHARANQNIQNPFNRLQQMDLGMFPVSGGLPIIVEDTLLGAVGVGGSGRDEDCAYAALTQVLGPQPPLAPNLQANAGAGGAAAGGGRGAGGRGAGGGGN